jgi:hypothetical protein
VRDRDGEFTTFNPPKSIGTFPTAINAADEIIGDYFAGLGQSPVYGFVRDRDGEITIINAPCSADFIFPTSINAAGVITGDYVLCGTHAFVRDRDGELTTFNGPAGSSFPSPTSINDRGAITGSYYNNASGVTHGFLRSPDHDEDDGQ